jgi:hypothetical protein
MPERKTIKRARQAEKQGKSASTQAGEFVREEIDHIRQGRHGARSTKQAIAIGLSKARRAGVKLPPPEKGSVSEGTRRKAVRDYQTAHSGGRPNPSRKRARATSRALKRESRASASKDALSKQATSAARQRTRAQRSWAGRKAARTRAKKR